MNAEVFVTKEDDDFVIYESRAIVRYIAVKYADQGPKLFPPTSDAKAYGLAEQAMNIEAFNFDQFASGVAFEIFAKP
jgi:glutathione S-transferase